MELAIGVARKHPPYLSLLFLIAVASAGAMPAAVQSSPGQGSRARQNTWSARSRTGVTFMGTWTAAAGPTGDTVTGTWTIFDAAGRTTRSGGWSAAKTPAGWSGSWRATMAGGKAEYSGTWKADVDLEADAPFSDLVEAAVRNVVSGGWSAGRESGAWSITARDPARR